VVSTHRFAQHLQRFRVRRDFLAELFVGDFELLERGGA